MRPRILLDDRPHRRATARTERVPSLTVRPPARLQLPPPPRSTASGPPWRLQSAPWRSTCASCALSPALPPAAMPPSRSRPTRRGRTSRFGQRTAAWLPAHWMSHCGWPLRLGAVTLTCVGGRVPGVRTAIAIHVRRRPIWPGADPGPALRSPAHPGPARPAPQEPVQPMLPGLQRGVSSYGLKLRMHVRRLPESKRLSKLQKIFPVKNSEIWQGFLRAR